jgi:hypothetical protein
MTIYTTFVIGKHNLDPGVTWLPEDWLVELIIGNSAKPVPRDSQKNSHLHEYRKEAAAQHGMGLFTRCFSGLETPKFRPMHYVDGY